MHDEIDWQWTCGGRYAEIRTDVGWVRAREDPAGWSVTCYDADGAETSPPALMTGDDLVALIVEQGYPATLL